MTPYYDEDGITIYHADCREMLSDFHVDAIVTDPPYGTGHYESDTDVFDADMLWQLTVIAPCAIFGWPERLVARCVEAGVVPTEWITWAATNAVCSGFNLHGLWRESEHIAIFGTGYWSSLRRVRSRAAAQFRETGYESTGTRCPSLPTEGSRLGDVWTDPAPGLGFNAQHRLHPNEKPITVIRRLVEGISREGEVILDPFMGSGTTLRAAKDAGRRAIGIEVNETHCETAVKRLAQGVLAL